MTTLQALAYFSPSRKRYEIFSAPQTSAQTEALSLFEQPLIQPQLLTGGVGLSDPQLVCSKYTSFQFDPSVTPAKN
jgi:hypothetical protein